MSGYKHATVTISEAEYRRLHESDMQNRFSSLPAHSTGFEPVRLEAIERMFSLFMERQQDFQGCITLLENEIGQVENNSVRVLLENSDAALKQIVEETNKSFQQAEENTEELHRQMLAGEAALQQELALSLEVSRNDAALVIQEYADRLNQQIQSIRQQQAGRLAGIQQQFAIISDENEQKEACARAWLESARAVRDFIETDYDHRRFMPGVFDGLDLQLQQAEENLAGSMPEAALAVSQQAYIECSLKRLELEEVTSHWQVIYIQALQNVDELLADILACRSLPAIDTSGQELDIDIDLVTWSGGSYLELKKKVQALRSHLRSCASSLTTEELDTIISIRIPDTRQLLNNLIYKARWEVVNSQIRINIADIAIQALEGQGFRIREHGFKESNMKEAYQISLTNVEGSQVIIRVNPLPEVEAGTDISIESIDQERRTESELRSRSLEITRSLARYGLRVGPLSMVQDLSVDKMRTPPIQRRSAARLARLSPNNHD
jgi:hypothetical protein